MTTKKRTRTIPARRFKPACVAPLDEVSASGGTIVVMKRGRPVAQVVPVAAPRSLVGSIHRERGLIAPIDDPGMQTDDRAL